MHFLSIRVTIGTENRQEVFPYERGVRPRFSQEDEESGEPVDVDADDEEYGLVIMKTVEENGEELLSTLDSDEEIEEIYNLFMERFFQEEDE